MGDQSPLVKLPYNFSCRLLTIADLTLWPSNLGASSFPSEMLNKSNSPSAWAIATNQSQQVFGLTLGGEFSTAINDCGLWYVCDFSLWTPIRKAVPTYRLSGIGSTPSTPDCAIWDDWAVCIVTSPSTCPWPSN